MYLRRVITNIKTCKVLTMNIPFPILYPRLVDPSWFSADSPCDEDAELTNMEQAHQQWVKNIKKINMIPMYICRLCAVNMYIESSF